jgi:predicted neuraminidase
MRAAAFVVVVAFLLTFVATAALAAEPGVIKSQFIYEKAPVPSCHASTIEQTPDGGLAVAFFGGSDEGENDVGIWFATNDNTGGNWTAPVEVATGVTPEENNRRYPCWNPVLFQPPGDAPLMLFYKVGPTPEAWWGMLITSADKGKTWTKPRRLPDGILGPVKNKPVLLSDGTLLCGSSVEPKGWLVHMESTSDLGRTWSKTPPLNDGKTIGAIQPGILAGAGNRSQPIRILCRTQQGRIAESTSDDGGKTWQSLKLIDLPNPNSGLDAVTLKDGRGLLVYNHTRLGRSPLNIAITEDGKTWKAGPRLETQLGEYSYPAVIQAKDGKVHVTYTWKRERIRHAVLDPQQFKLTDVTPLVR